MGVGGWNASLPKGLYVFAGSCSVYFPNAKFGMGGGREEKTFGSCISHLYAVTRVESEYGKQNYIQSLK